ncbi:putative HNH endonuclease (plasmid) [Selenomonas ruminantium subsp. lactilytica TAM6421]|uniref:Putative HNH endonuclease n=1 Tax=Selenomonas ruminantium subsp. lactilytica (strain NBRC 103574 / TAM6421) TaxID=927704 RepID=I0GWM5_SELRL|nr:HNH endonuclease [Selenomonas ruminantium]BAL85162.1 putative HNH endonuclease [Selenomonas ruminantium subsp. lactilytica TAM6421]
MKKIPLSGKRGENLFTLVDDDIYEKYSSVVWHVNGQSDRPYCINDKLGLLHRVIMGAQVGMMVDHINHNTLDNRRENLRLVSAKENAWNSKKTDSRDCTSKFKGVTRDRFGHWCVMFWKDNKAYTKDSYPTELEAAVKYNEWAKKFYGEYACLNEFTEKEKQAIKILPFIPCNEYRMTRSPYHGVSYNTKKKRWGWRFFYKGKMYYDQYCDSPEDARDKLIKFLSTFDGEPRIKKYYPRQEK